ncbi:MAG: hypothetical protein K1X47_10800 [Cyclobacteriaceae bacterium]|nr:hypothetical protein [Cyclobacteriaceae bacterium]
MKGFLLGVLLLGSAVSAPAQDLLNMLEGEADKTKGPDFATATFKTTRLINGHSIENVAPGVLDFRISHRFGFVNRGISEFYGLDVSTIRLGLDYGISKRLMVGLGRSSYQKQLDAFAKFKILRQANGGMPLSLSVVSSAMIKTGPYDNPDRPNYFSSRLYYSWQVLIARKFSEGISLQLMPSVVHYNLVEAPEVINDVIALGAGGRFKLSKRVSLNLEYYYQLPDHKFTTSYNSLAVGFDIETGGHVFQLQFTNSTGMTERTFISETDGNVAKGDIHFGFNISRVFTIKDPRQ